ncbi:MAG: RNA-binding S4 domain-containing protein [Candidatus Cryptobacteroides sp.]|nr:RNA-binding S4 domain-containing protein [Candidatus Cryptobacteroides sp.]
MEVRLDKYLWAIRVYKTRTDATDACKGGKIRVNGLDVKPSREVKVGDVITARKGAVLYTFKVKELLSSRVGAALVPQYAENLTPQEELDKLRAPVETFFLKRDRGAGRPTKKDRRQMESLWDSLDYDGLDMDDVD